MKCNAQLMQYYPKRQKFIILKKKTILRHKFIADFELKSGPSVCNYEINMCRDVVLKQCLNVIINNPRACL